jgi:hypothetical protein
MQIIRHSLTGHLIACDDESATAATLSAARWAGSDCEDVSEHPVFTRQLATLRRNDGNGFCDLTDKPFTPAQLAKASNS